MDTCLWTEIQVPTTWGTLRGKKIGNGPRKILGVHGWLDNADTFDLLVPLLKGDFTFISLDLPGHGKSDHFCNGFIYDVRGYSGALKKAVDVLKWTKFIYLGHSMGALVGIFYSSVFPEDIDAFISIDIIKPWSLGSSEYALNYRRYFDSYFDNENKGNLPPLVYSWSELVTKTIEGSFGSLDAPCAELLLKRGTRKSPDGEGFILTRDLKAKSYFIGFIPAEAWIAMAEKITCPIFIIKAKQGHLYDTKERQAAMLEAYEKNCRMFWLRELEGRHHLHLTNTRPVADLIQEFLEDIMLLNEHQADDSFSRLLAQKVNFRTEAMNSVADSAEFDNSSEAVLVEERSISNGY